MIFGFRFRRPGSGVRALGSGQFALLFVCAGNLCRSPLALVAFNALLRRRGIERQFRVDSAGTHVRRHAGQQPDARALEVARRRGYDQLSAHKARSVISKDFHRFDLIVAVDGDVLTSLQRLCPVEQRHKLHLLMEFSHVPADQDIPDPYYGNVQGFERVLELCELGVAGLLDECTRRAATGLVQTR